MHDLFLFEDDLFRYEAEIIRNEPCAGMGQNKLVAELEAQAEIRQLEELEILLVAVCY